PPRQERTCISNPPSEPAARGPCLRNTKRNPRQTGRFPPASRGGRVPPTRSPRALLLRDRTLLRETDARAACYSHPPPLACPRNRVAPLHKSALATQTSPHPAISPQPPKGFRAIRDAARHHHSAPPHRALCFSETLD